MTGTQRTHLRHAISEARRARLTAAYPRCEHCGDWFEPSANQPPGRQRFCRNACRNAQRRATADREGILMRGAQRDLDPLGLRGCRGGSRAGCGPLPAEAQQQAESLRPRGADVLSLHEGVRDEPTVPAWAGREFHTDAGVPAPTQGRRLGALR